MHEEVLLCDKSMEVYAKDIEKLVSFLGRVYEDERIGYKVEVPPFNVNAAVFGAKVVYVSSQALLYRDTELEEMPGFMLNPFEPSTLSEALSADLCLRFLPSILFKFEEIEHDDPLIPLLKKILHLWPYSGIRFFTEVDQLNHSALLEGPEMNKLIIDRIINERKLNMALDNRYRANVSNSLGIYDKELWEAFSIKNIEHE